MQALINLLVVLNTLILGFGVYMVVTAKQVRVSHEKRSAKSKNPVKAAGEFEVTPIIKSKRKAQVKSTDSGKAKKGRR